MRHRVAQTIGIVTRFRFVACGMTIAHPSTMQHMWLPIVVATFGACESRESENKESEDKEGEVCELGETFTISVDCEGAPWVATSDAESRLTGLVAKPFDTGFLFEHEGGTCAIEIAPPGASIASPGVGSTIEIIRCSIDIGEGTADQTRIDVGGELWAYAFTSGDLMATGTSCATGVMTTVLDRCAWSGSLCETVDDPCQSRPAAFQITSWEGATFELRSGDSHMDPATGFLFALGRIEEFDCCEGDWWAFDGDGVIVKSAE